MHLVRFEVVKAHMEIDLHLALHSIFLEEPLSKVISLKQILDLLLRYLKFHMVPAFANPAVICYVEICH